MPAAGVRNAPTLPRQRPAEVVLQPWPQAYILEEKGKKMDMKLHIINTTNGLSFLAVTTPDRHIDALPGWRDELFATLSFTAYRNDTGVHFLRVRDEACPGGYPDRSFLG